MVVELWICPNCHNYYGSSSVHGVDLAKEMNTKLNTPEQTHSRAQCPQCKTERKLQVLRVLDPS